MSLRRAVALVMVALSAAACTDVPDLAPVSARLAPGTAGLGADRVPDDAARTPFGRRIARAVRAAPALGRSVADLRAARAETAAARGALRPDVSLGLRTEARRVAGVTARDTSPVLRVSQLVYDAGAARADRTAARAGVLQSRARQIETAAQTTLSAVDTYQRLITSRRLSALAEEELRSLRRIAQRIEERAERGAGSGAETLVARSRIASAETRRVEARARLDRAAAAYRRSFGAPPAHLPAPVPAPALPAAAGDSVAESPRLRAAAARLKAAEAELAAARARRAPAVELGATGRRAPSGDGLDVGLDLSLEYSLDTRGARRAAVAAAEARRDAARADRDRLRREVREALAVVRSDQAAGTARIAAAREAVRAQEARVAAVRDQFRIGRSRLIDLLDARRDAIRARETLIRAEAERLLTDYAALALTGDILDVFDIDLPEAEP